MSRLRSEDRIPSPERLRKLLRYVSESGKLFWAPRKVGDFPERNTEGQVLAWNSLHADREAFTANDKGYLTGQVDGAHYFAHRVVWAICHGRWPVGEIDHINGLKSDNRISNLREVTRKENSRNCRLHRGNTSGVTGVSFHRLTGKWAARIQADDKSKHLGLFPSIAEAAAARKAAELANGYHPNHGRAQAPALIERGE